MTAPKDSAFIEPLDVWSFRGNRSFGEAGSWGQAQMPPPPSVLAGALRSARLVRDGIDLAAFARNETTHPAIGSRDTPGPFTLAAATVARRSGNGHIEPIFPLPADLVAIGAQVHRLRPAALDARLATSSRLPQVAVLAGVQGKPGKQRWLTAAGLRRWLADETVPAVELAADGQLWRIDERVGVALEPRLRRADDGKLFSLQALACQEGVGLAVRVAGCELAPGLLRLGGDGHGARLVPTAIDWPAPDYAAIARARRCRLLLTNPGLFPAGWLPTGAQPENERGDGAVRFELHGVAGWIVCAAVPRPQVVSGWDLARWQPKPAERAAPAGSVWWLELDEGVTADALRKLVECGLWSAPCEDEARRAEGYNRCLLGIWRDTP
jgi:CRISPR-associated protein Cmr3